MRGARCAEDPVGLECLADAETHLSYIYILEYTRIMATFRVYSWSVYMALDRHLGNLYPIPHGPEMALLNVDEQYTLVDSRFTVEILYY